MSLPLSEDKPHRTASNSCKKVHDEMVTCYKQSKCFAEYGYTFRQCLDSKDGAVVGDDCIVLRKAYAQCRRNLTNPAFRQMGNPYSA